MAKQKCSSPDCKELKPEFYVGWKRPIFVCKVCHRKSALKATKKWRVKHPGKYKENQKEWNKRNPGKSYEYKKRRMAKDPEYYKFRARLANRKSYWRKKGIEVK